MKRVLSMASILTLAAVAGAQQPTDPVACPVCDTAFDFSKVPPAIHPQVRAGWFPIPPSGPGYYSLADWFTGTCRDKPPPFPLPPFTTSTLSFFDLDYSYIDKPGYEKDWPEKLKRMKLGDNWMLSVGGQAWFRFEDASNARLTRVDDNYTLMRARPYLDLWYQDRVRLFVEGMFADSYGENLPARLIDVNRADFQNLFLDLKLGTYEDKPVYARVGRQEVQFGSQRLIACPDWANTRFTYDGARIFRVGDKWDTDLFWLQPRVNLNANGLNSKDNNINLAGAWATYKPKKGTTRDFYFLMLDSTNTVTELGIKKAPFTNYTFGSRAAGDVDGEYLYDFEGAMQLGTRGQSDIVAGFATAGLGYHWKDRPWNPTVWAYYDYASGTPNPNVGDYNTFNQIFPFGHYYFGWIDVVGRQNIHDVNFALWLYPAKWLTVWIQQHNFWLASKKDALYNAGGVAIRRDPSGNAGSYVGSELDLIFNFHLTKRADVLTGYSYLWGGEFLKNTEGRNLASQSGLFYLSYSYRW